MLWGWGGRGLIVVPELGGMGDSGIRGFRTADRGVGRGVGWWSRGRGNDWVGIRVGSAWPSKAIESNNPGRGALAALDLKAGGKVCSPTRGRRVQAASACRVVPCRVASSSRSPAWPGPARLSGGRSANMRGPPRPRFNKRVSSRMHSLSHAR